MSQSHRRGKFIGVGSKLLPHTVFVRCGNRLSTLIAIISWSASSWVSAN